MKKLLSCLLTWIFIMTCITITYALMDSARDVYNSIVSEFDDKDYEKVIAIYEVDMQHRLPRDREDSTDYYFYAKAVLAVDAGDLTEASKCLALFNNDFKDTVLFRHYVRGLDYEARGEYDLAIDEFNKAEGFWDSRIRIYYMPTPTSNPIITLNEPGDILTFGNYHGEAIQWRVLAVENGKALVISEKIIDAKPYNTEWVGVTWETCTLRQWLNNDFSQTAFTQNERERIAETTNVTKSDAEYDTMGSNNTNDKASLLSLDEAEAYFMTGADYIAYASTYAKGQGCWVDDENGASDWWLRSSGCYSNYYAASVLLDGSVNVGGDGVDYINSGVRPALWLNP